MFPAPSHLVLVQTHLDLTPAQASQEYILEGCPHPFTQTSVFNYSILNVFKTKVIELFFLKGSSSGKHCFFKGGWLTSTCRTSTESHLDEWQEHVTTQLCKPNTTAAHRLITHADFRATHKYPLSSHEEAKRAEK